MSSPTPSQPPMAPPTTREEILHRIHESFANVNMDTFAESLSLPPIILLHCLERVKDVSHPSVDPITGQPNGGFNCPLSIHELAAELNTPSELIHRAMRAIINHLNMYREQQQQQQAPNLPPPPPRMPLVNPPRGPAKASAAPAKAPAKAPTAPRSGLKVQTLLGHPQWPKAMPSHIHELHRAVQTLYSSGAQHGKDLLVIKRSDMYALLEGAKGLDMKGSVMWTELINKSDMSEEEKKVWKEEEWYLEGVELGEEDSGDDLVVVGSAKVRGKKRKAKAEGGEEGKKPAKVAKVAKKEKEEEA